VIDIDDLTEDQLLELNHRVIERLRYLDQLKAHRAMMKYRPGDRVSFRARDGREVTGMLLKYNQKTVTVIADNGQRWNVSPGLLSQEALEGERVPSERVVPIRRE
jgi:hypothetical protein